MTVLGFVATSPDIRLRARLSEKDSSAVNDGPTIYTFGLDEDEHCKGDVPQTGDVLVSLQGKRTNTFTDFAVAMASLRGAEVQAGWSLTEGTVLESLPEDASPLVEIEKGGGRWVKIEFERPGNGELYKAYLRVQTLPLSDVMISLVWYLLQLAVFAVGGLAYWNRPFDRSSRAFFILGSVTLAAFVGGYHWWFLASSFWFGVPYIVCALFVPATLLHFILVYPQPRWLMSTWPRVAISLIYLPVITGTALVLIVLYSIGQVDEGASGIARVAGVKKGLNSLHLATYWGFAFAGLYFLLALAVSLNGYRRSRNPMERQQLSWVCGANLFATIFVATMVIVIMFYSSQFAVGFGRMPLFLISLCLMLGYSVPVVRYKLMLVDQIATKGVLYYALTTGVTVLVSLAVAVWALWPQILNISLTQQQTLMVTAVTMLSVMLLLWLRDRFQQIIDREFFREKYQIDKALQKMNRAVEHLADPESLTAMMLSSCRDVLGVKSAALYLKASADSSFQLIASEGDHGALAQIDASDAFAIAMQEGGILRRVSPDSETELTPVQSMMRQLRAFLALPLGAEDGIGGFIVLGEKKSGTSFNAEDFAFLNALGQITHVALRSARVNQNAMELNEELRRQTDTIAEQKRELTLLQAEVTSLQDRRASRNPKRTSKDKAEEKQFLREEIIGNSPAIQTVLDMARKVAVSESSVLIRGESGTGKELLANVLHSNSLRNKGPLVCVHCASLSPNLLESELFGHVKGAFTGAHRDKVGRFEMASGGTLFLDEIGDISLDTQVKLLRILQERRFEPVGGTRSITSDVRLVTATHQDLEKLIAAGRFREDLFYRLNVINLTLPPLRERMEDLPELAFFLLQQAAQRMEKNVSGFESEAMEALTSYRWPGNIRELGNAIERAVVLCEKKRISLAELPEELVTPRIERTSSDVTFVEMKPLSNQVEMPSPESFIVEQDAPSPKRKRKFENDEQERQELEHALQQCSGNKAEAARMLGMPRSTYYSKLKKYSIR